LEKIHGFRGTFVHSARRLRAKLGVQRKRHRAAEASVLRLTSTLTFLGSLSCLIVASSHVVKHYRDISWLQCRFHYARALLVLLGDSITLFLLGFMPNNICAGKTRQKVTLRVTAVNGSNVKACRLRYPPGSGHSALTGFRSVPIPLIVASTISPSLRNGAPVNAATPSGVPVEIISPGFNVMPAEMYSIR